MFFCTDTFAKKILIVNYYLNSKSLVSRDNINHKVVLGVKLRYGFPMSPQPKTWQVASHKWNMGPLSQPSGICSQEELDIPQLNTLDAKLRFSDLLTCRVDLL